MAGRAGGRWAPGTTVPSAGEESLCVVLRGPDGMVSSQGQYKKVKGMFCSRPVGAGCYALT